MMVETKILAVPPRRIAALGEETLTCDGRLSAIRSMTRSRSDTGAYFDPFF